MGGVQLLIKTNLETDGPRGIERTPSPISGWDAEGSDRYPLVRNRTTSPARGRKTPKRRPKSGPTVDREAVRPAVGTLSRTKSLLLAALKVWELKNGIGD